MKQRKLYYTDGEIYINLKQGVKPHILAELNACSVKEIFSARDRYAEKLQRADDEYNILKDELLRRKEEVAKHSRRAKYSYDKETIERIKFYLSKDVSKKEIYDKLFGKATVFPLYSTFLVKCRNLLSEMDIIYFGNSTIEDIEKEEIDDGVENNSETISQNDSKKSLRSQLQEKRQAYYEEVGELAEKMRKIMYEIAKIDISIEQLDKDSIVRSLQG